MEASPRGIIALAVSEGIAKRSYLDSVGVWTIGVGHTASAGAPDPKQIIGTELSVEQCLALMKKDLSKYEQFVRDAVKVPIAQQEFDALVHFTYNVGPGSLNKSKLLKNLNAGNKQLAFSKGFHGFLKQKELLSRRDKERDMALKGAYGSTVAPIYSATPQGKLQRLGSIDLSGVVIGNAPTPTPKPTTQPTKQSFWQWLISWF